VNSPQSRYLLALSLLPSLRGCLSVLLAQGAVPEDLFGCSTRELVQRWGLAGERAERVARERDGVDPDWEAERVATAGAGYSTLLDEAYPERLRRTPSPPPVLYSLGEEVTGPAVAVVGARKPSSYGLSVAEKLASELASCGVVVVSGFALGIDVTAHRACLDAGGKTIAVLGSGVDVWYPRRHAAVGKRLVERGCFISELPLGTQPLPFHFPLRNRIISGMSLATVVVEADLNSGSLYTADFALAQGREVLAVPGSIYSPTCRGTNSLLVDGAWPVRSAEDVFDAIGLEPPHQAVQRKERLSERERAVSDVFDGEPLTIEEVVQRARRPAGEVAVVLTLLELKGLLRRGLDQRYMIMRT